MKKAPRAGAWINFWMCASSSGGDGACLLPRDFFFGAEPIFQFVAVFPASFLIEFVGAVDGSGIRVRTLVARLSRSSAVSSRHLHSWGETPLGAKLRLNLSSVNYRRLVQAGVPPS